MNAALDKLLGFEALKNSIIRGRLTRHWTKSQGVTRSLNDAEKDPMFQQYRKTNPREGTACQRGHDGHFTPR